MKSEQPSPVFELNSTNPWSTMQAITPSAPFFVHTNSVNFKLLNFLLLGICLKIFPKCFLCNTRSVTKIYWIVCISEVYQKYLLSNWKGKFFCGYCKLSFLGFFFVGLEGFFLLFFALFFFFLLFVLFFVFCFFFCGGFRLLLMQRRILFCSRQKVFFSKYLLKERLVKIIWTVDIKLYQELCFSSRLDKVRHSKNKHLSFGWRRVRLTKVASWESWLLQDSDFSLSLSLSLSLTHTLTHTLTRAHTFIYSLMLNLYRVPNS